MDRYSQHVACYSLEKKYEQVLQLRTNLIPNEFFGNLRAAYLLKADSPSFHDRKVRENRIAKDQEIKAKHEEIKKIEAKDKPLRDLK